MVAYLILAARLREELENLDPERVIELVDELPTVFERVTADIKRFLDFLDIAGQTPMNDES